METKRKNAGFFYALGFLFLSLFVLEMFSVIFNAHWVIFFDEFFTQYIYESRNIVLNSFVRLSTHIGSKEFIFVVTIVVTIVLFWRKKFALGILFVGIIGLSAIFLKYIKILVARSRPDSLGWLIDVGGFSYPSGHLLLTSVFYGLIALFLINFFSKMRIKILSGIFALIIIVFVAYTRIYLGVHYPSDVLGGALFGLAWVFFASGLYLSFIQKNSIK